MQTSSSSPQPRRHPATPDWGLRVHCSGATTVAFMPAPDTTSRSVAVVTLGCTRNDVDSEELAGRLAMGGWTLVDDAAEADVAVVNTCGFVEQAKKDSIDSLIEASSLKESGRTQKVVAVGCLAERYGQTLADELPEAAPFSASTPTRHVDHCARSSTGGPSRASRATVASCCAVTGHRQVASADVPCPPRRPPPARDRALAR